MTDIIFPSWVLTEAPDTWDTFMFSDISDWGKLKKSEATDIVASGILWITSDDVTEWSSNLFMTPTEKSKLSTVSLWAEPNAVDSVNGFGSNVTLTQDNIPNGSIYVQTENNYSNAEVGRVNDAYNHSLVNSGNPHSVTKSDVWLGNVTNDSQLKRSSNDRAFTNKPNLADADRVLIEDSSNSFDKAITTVSSLIDKFSQSISFFTSKSIEAVAWFLQLKNDVETPENLSLYWYEDWSKWWFPNMVRKEYNNEDINIDSNRQLIIYWQMSGQNNVYIYWDLVIL